MAKAGAITEPTFSFHLSGLAGKSYIDFGTPNSAAMKGGDPSQVIYIQSIAGKIHWTNYITAMRFTSNTSDLSTKSLTKTEATTDTGSSCILGPSSDIS